MPRKGENIYRRKDGRWEGRVRIEKKKYVSVYAHSYGEVRRKVAEIRATTVFNAADVTFDAASRAWLKHSETRVKPSSLSNYTYLLNKHILPYFKDIKLSDLSRHDLHNFIDMKLTNGRLKRIGGISKKYLRDRVSIVKSVAAYAEQEFEIQNRIRYAETVKVEKAKINVPDKVEKQTLYKYLNGNKGGTYVHIGTPKTASSARIIPIAPKLMKLLQSCFGKNELFILSGTNDPIEPARLRNEFLHILKSCGLPHMKFHTLRHIFASSCIRQGFDVAAVSEMLGHSNKSMTLDRYTHSSMETKQKYMRSFRL